MQPLKFVLQAIELGIRQIFHLHQGGASRLNSPNQFVQFQLNDLGIAILRILNQENHQKRAERGRCVDDELPSIRVMKARSG